MAGAARRRSDAQPRSTADDTLREQIPRGVAVTDQTGSDEVARRAYELYQRRGGDHGRDWDDWFQAEEEIRAKGDTAEDR